MSPVCKDCGKPLTLQEEQYNKEHHKNYYKNVGKRSKLELCASCWESYAHHAMTGE